MIKNTVNVVTKIAPGLAVEIRQVDSGGIQIDQTSQTSQRREYDRPVNTGNSVRGTDRSK